MSGILKKQIEKQCRKEFGKGRCVIKAVGDDGKEYVVTTPHGIVTIEQKEVAAAR